MTLTGKCHCGAIAYEISGDPIGHGLCHCGDCRGHAGAPMVGWVMYPEGALTVTKGDAKIYKSSEHARRHFCGDCGTGLFYFNPHVLPGLVDIQSGTLDDPEAVPAEAHIMTKERLDWMASAHKLPEFEEFPPQG